MSYRLHSSKGLIKGLGFELLKVVYIGGYYRAYQGDTRSADYSSYTCKGKTGLDSVFGLVFRLRGLERGAWGSSALHSTSLAGGSAVCAFIPGADHQASRKEL